MHCVNSIKLRTPASCTATSYWNRPSRKLFCFGLGYVGFAFANYLRPLEWEISGTCTSANKASWLQKQGVKTLLYDGKTFSEDVKEELLNSTHVLITIPPGPQPLFNEEEEDSTYLMHNAEWIGYLSSTSVYGDWSGDWVDEESETRTESNRGRLRLTGEKQWMKLFHQKSLPIHIFRLGGNRDPAKLKSLFIQGIYGPGRNLLESLLDKDQDMNSMNQQRRNAQQWINRCHVYDICQVNHSFDDVKDANFQVLSKSMENPKAGEVYNIVDDQPSPRAYGVEIANGLKQGARIEWSLPPEYFGLKGRTRKPTSRVLDAMLEEKRVRNQKIKTDLNITLAYPNIDVGLFALSKGMKLPFSD